MMPPSTIGGQVIQQTELGHASVQHDEPEVEEIPAARAKGSTKKRGTRIKLGNFNLDKDIYLTKSWLEVSTDPLINASQRKNCMWERVVERYNMKRTQYPKRTLRYLQSRWDVIKTEVGKFASLHADVIRENASGLSDADKTTLAASNFTAIYTHNFGYMHCWNLLKDETKWQDLKGRDEANTAAGQDFGQDISTQADSSSLGHDCTPSGSACWRSMGRDASKAAKKRGNSTAGSSASSEFGARMQELSLQRVTMMQEESMRKNQHFEEMWKHLQEESMLKHQQFDEMWQHNQSLIHLEEEKIRLKREKHEIKRQQEEERILGINLDTVLAAQREYYQAHQEAILEKIRDMHWKRQGQ